MKWHISFSCCILFLLSLPQLLNAQVKVNKDPLSFKMINSSGKNIVFINPSPTSKGQEMRIDLHNRAQDTLLFFPEPDSVSASSYHFLFYIVNTGTPFSKTTLENIQLSPESQQIYEMKRNLTYPSAPYFYIRIKDVKNYSIAPKADSYIALTGFKAEGTNGPNSEVSIGLTYQEAHYPKSTEKIGASLTSIIQIKQPSGLENIPLHAGLLGTNSVLNNGFNTTDLLIGLENILPIDSVTNPATHIRFNKDSKILVSFQLEPHSQAPWKYPWALTTKTLFSQIPLPIVRINGKVRTDLWKGTYALNDLSFVLVSQDSSSLKPGDVMTISLNNIKSKMPDGVSHINIHYQKVIGYFDGYFSIPVLKGNVAIDKHQVAIGMKPSNQFTSGSSLEVNGGIYASLGIPNGDEGYSFLPDRTNGLYSSKPGELLVFSGIPNRKLVMTENKFSIHNSVDSTKQVFTIDGKGNATITDSLSVGKSITSGKAIYASEGNPIDDGETGFTFTQNRGVGMFGSKDGSIALYTGKKKRLSLDTLGQLGITETLWSKGAIYAKGGGPTSSNVGFNFGDKGTGMYSAGNGEISFYTNGVERMKIDGGGNITYDKIQAESSVQVNGGKIPVPYGTTDDWTILTSYNQQIDNNHSIFYINNIDMGVKVLPDKTGWTVTCKIIGPGLKGDSNSDFHIIDETDCSINYILIKK